MNNDLFCEYIVRRLPWYLRLYRQTKRQLSRILDRLPVIGKRRIAAREEAYNACFKKLQFPIVRRVFPSLITNEIVSVQPMSVSASLLFYVDYKYGGSFPEEIELDERDIEIVEDNNERE